MTTKLSKFTKQLNKLVEVVKVVDLSEGDHIERELMLIKSKQWVQYVPKLNVLPIFSGVRLLM
jgi:acetolactate synthase small subunit